MDWAKDNEEMLVELLFDIDSDIYDNYDPHSGFEDVLHTEEDYIAFSESYEPDYHNEAWLNFVSEVYDSMAERCEECLCLLSDENMRTESEGRGEYWGAPSYEDVVVGYSCPHCGHHERI